jgi:hypothetical protein
MINYDNKPFLLSAVSYPLNKIYLIQKVTDNLSVTISIEYERIAIAI